MGLIINADSGTIDLNRIKEQLEVTWARVTLSPLDVSPPPCQCYLSEPITRHNFIAGPGHGQREGSNGSIGQEDI